MVKFLSRFILLTLTVVLLAGCAARPGGGVAQVRVADGSDGLAGLDRVVVTLRDAAMHPADAPRDEGWVDIPLIAPVVDLGAVGPTGQIVARGPFPPAVYDRVRVEIAEVVGEKDGAPVPIRNIVEPIYLEQPLDRGPATLRITLIVLPRESPDEPERYALFTKAVAVR
ncbi:MAG: hypothetical protein U0768_16230 [Anaerolineae bacterium]